MPVVQFVRLTQNKLYCAMSAHTAVSSEKVVRHQIIVGFGLFR